MGELLKHRRETVAVAESSTGGLISASLLSIPGASAYYAGGTVVYTRASRKIFLDLPVEELKKLKPMTEEMAMVFAESIRRTLDSTWGISELGAAGPTGTPYGYDAGTSVIAVSGPNPLSETVVTGDSDRGRNMLAFSEAAIALLQRAIEEAQ